MAKKEEKTISKEDLKSPSGFMVPGDIFDNASGETFAGLNILRLKEGEAAGPFRLKEILPNQKLGENKKMKPVDVYVAIPLNGAAMDIRMPAAASFVSKAKEALLAVGDEFYVKRSEDYVAKKFGKNNCASYLLKVSNRAAKKK